MILNLLFQKGDDLMKRRFTICALPVLAAFAALAVSCDSLAKTDGGAAFQSENGYVYSEDEPFGMTRAEAEELYADSLGEIADDRLEQWRVEVPTELIPPENAELFGREWMRQLSFDGDAFYLGTYTTRMEPEEFDEEFPAILEDCYATFGEGSITQEEYEALVEEALAAEAGGTATRVSGYWTGGEDNYLHLYVLLGVRPGYEEVVIAVSGGTDRVRPFSGSDDLTGLMDAVKEMQQP